MVYGRVYSLRSHQTSDIYIGSTTESLSRRIAQHRSDYKRFSTEKKGNYVSSYEIIKYEDAYIELIFEGEFESKNALHRKEGECIREMNCVNKRIEGRTKQEYAKDNKEYISQYKKQWREEHIEERTEYLQKYRAEHKVEEKQYREEHKDELAKKRKERNKIKYECSCGSICSISGKAEHERSQKHQTFLSLPK
jgi:hypothetical protein